MDGASSLQRMPKPRERTDFAERVYRARIKAGLSQRELAVRAGLSQTTISEAETIALGSSRVLQIATALGVSPAWLATGAGAMELAEAQAVDLDNHPDLTRIRAVNLKLQAGLTGFAVESEIADSPPIFFRADWMQARGFKPYKLLALKVRGQSMEPTLYADDLVVANTADTEPKDGEVYAVNYEGEAVIKRLVRDGGSWWLASDNPDQRRYPRKEWVDGNAIVIGRIVHRQSERI
jgi:phage repressor protein C with HTH and peptisase S24 domain